MSEGKKKRKARQHKRKLFQLIREDLQLSGDIPVMPEGGLRPERVDPAKQSEQSLPQLTNRAIRNGWSVPEEKKPKLVDELLEIVGSQSEPAKVKVAAFNALVKADQVQNDRDNQIVRPQVNNTTNVTNIAGDLVNNKLQVAATIREMIEGGHLGLIGEDDSETTSSESNGRVTEESQTPDQSSTPGVSGQ